jgi:phospholipid/cholesterol/gamma-HCH transport system ATP-binding protein
MIHIDSLYKSLGGVPVLWDLTLGIRNGEILALIGPSGTGKSVLLKHIIGLLEPDHGDVLIDEQSIVKADYQTVVELRGGMGYVFQDAALLDSLTVHENLRLAINDREYRKNPKHADHRIGEALNRVNLEPVVLSRLPRELSGGMRKRVGVARAIINQPRVLLYDEPTTGLDPRNVAVIDELILRNRDAFHATSVVVTHDLPSVKRVADRVALLQGGAIEFIGTPDQLFTSNHPAVRAFIDPTAEEST